MARKSRMDLHSIWTRWKVQTLIIVVFVAAFVGLAVTFHPGTAQILEEVNVEPTVAGNVNSLTMTCNATPTAGNVIFASIISSSTSGFPYVSSVVQTNVAWTQIINGSYQVSSVQYIGNCIWEGIVNSGAGTSISISFGNTNGVCVADAAEFSGVWTNTTSDKIASSCGLSASVTTGTTSTLSQDNELCIGSIMCQSNVTSPTNGYNLIDGSLNQGSWSDSLLWLASSDTVGQSTGITVSSSDYYSGLIATFFAN
jgi:hypothetical protein